MNIIKRQEGQTKLKIKMEKKERKMVKKRKIRIKMMIILNTKQMKRLMRNILMRKESLELEKRKLK
jgi:hypothetical protein